MKKVCLFLMLMFLWTTTAHGQELTAPEPPGEVMELMPSQSGSFSEDLWYVIKSAVGKLEPEIVDGAKLCMVAMALVLVTGILSTFPGASQQVIELAGSIAIAGVLLQSTGSLILSASSVVTELSDYAKLLLPVMATATAAQGGITSSTALYTGTVIFNAVLCGLIATILIPLIYAFLALSISKCALGNDLLDRMQKLSKWLVTWLLKTILYVFTGYIAITGVVSGTADQSVLKATKLTISGMVPVVGGILSDASEAVLASAGIVKTSVGIYGLIALSAIAIGPFLKIGVQYLLLKITSGICSTFGGKHTSAMVASISDAMGLLLAMTGAVCFMLFISMVCFLKGGG